MNDKDMKRLEHAVLKYLTKQRGGRHYKTFELMYKMIETYKFDKLTLQRWAQEAARVGSL